MGVPKELRRPAFWASLFVAAPVIGLGWQLIARGPIGRKFPQISQVVTAANASQGA
jgi:hypothetical protein